MLEEKKNGSISGFCFSRSRLFQQQQQAGMCWQPTYRLHKLRCADKLLTMATRKKRRGDEGNVSCVISSRLFGSLARARSAVLLPSCSSNQLSTQPHEMLS